MLRVLAHFETCGDAIKIHSQRRLLAEILGIDGMDRRLIKGQAFLAGDTILAWIQRFGYYLSAHCGAVRQRVIAQSLSSIGTSLLDFMD